VAFTYLKVKFAKCLCVLPVVLYLDLVYRQLSAQPPHRLLPLNHFCLDCHSVCIPFIDYVQRSSSCLYRRLRYRNCLNYITLHYITLLFWSWSSEFGLVYITGCCFRGSCKCSMKPRPIRCEPRFHLFELVIHAKRRRMLNSVIDEHRRERTNRQFWSAITDY